MKEDYEKIIYLNLEHYPDCKKCKDPSKKEVGHMIDAEGPGVISPVYWCDNKHCKIKKQYLDRIIINQAMEAERKGTDYPEKRNEEKR